MGFTSVLAAAEGVQSADRFEGRFISGAGDAEYLRLLDASCRVFQPDPELQSITMLYTPAWNGFVEGPTWGAWWIQNSYGPSFCAMPFLTEPCVTFLQNAQDLWFSQMGDGKRKGYKDWVAPDGCLCDAAAPGWIVYKQGDGRIDIHDWGMEFTAAGVVMQSELLLIGRDSDAIKRYLPMLERCANFIETRRDPSNNLFLAGAAGNLLAPSFAGYKKPDGTYDKAYLTGLSITHIAALDRLIELEKLAGNPDMAAHYAGLRDSARKGLALLTTDEGYFIKYLDPDGTRHGVFGAKKFGYFEAVCNHDAVAFRVADDAQAAKICGKIASIPGLRPNDVIITNHPSLDDMYEAPNGLWSFGRWVNGGHWTTCEARMIMAYYRVGRFEEARRAMKQIMKFYETFRTDNPLVDFGDNPYQPNLPINCVYDTWGAPAGFVRGLFEYLYKADGLTLMPHIPSAITRLEQKFPIRFGTKRLYISTAGSGEITSVEVNGTSWKTFDKTSVFLSYDETPDVASVTICMGGVSFAESQKSAKISVKETPALGNAFWDISDFAAQSAGNTHPLRIGADSNGETRFVGDIRRARIFNRALSVEEIAALAASPTASLKGNAGPVADYILDKADGGAIANAAGGGLTAKITGKADFADSPSGKALRLAGESFVEVAHDPRLSMRDAYTLDAWIRPEKMSERGGRIINKVTSGVDDGFLLDTYPGNSLRLITEQGHAEFDAKLTPGEWVHVAGTLDRNGEMRLFINGKVVASGKGQPAPAAQPWRRVGEFHHRLCKAGMGDSYEAAHAGLVIDYVAAIHERLDLRAQGKLKLLPDASQLAADRSYVDTVNKLVEGLGKTIQGYEKTDDPRKKRILAIWRECAPE